jgi:flagellum-specific ATP synthase
VSEYAEAVRRAQTFVRTGDITRVSGHSLEAMGPDVRLGEVCEVLGRDPASPSCLAEVVAVQAGRVVLMPYAATHGIGVGARVVAHGHAPRVPVGRALLGRVIDAFGTPLDGGGSVQAHSHRSLHPAPRNPLSRLPIQQNLATGVRVIDTLLPLGRGQRVGIFAGSGVGKSSLMGMLARNVQADINVVALIGERGREVLEFVQRLDASASKRTVVLAATSDQPAVVRARAAYAATAIAEHFRDEGASVFLLMDSVTRFAMARREIDLAAGLPPTARGYTPSVFTEIPALCERCGTGDAETKGAITAIYTVLVEGDDPNEPISDTLRATLDGHIVLSRELAHQGHFPAIDVLRSISRLEEQLASPSQRELQARLRALLAVHARQREMVDMGLYKGGANPQLDEALKRMPAIQAFLKQGLTESTPAPAAWQALATTLAQGG